MLPILPTATLAATPATKMPATSGWLLLLSLLTMLLMVAHWTHLPLAVQAAESKTHPRTTPQRVALARPARQYASAQAALLPAAAL